MNSTYTSIKNQVQSLIDTANNKTGLEDADLTSAVEHLLAKYGVGSGVEAIPAEDIAFSSEHNDADTALYAMGYNWFADLVGHVQDMSGSGRDMKPADVLYWLGKVKYISQLLAISSVDYSKLTIKTTAKLKE